MPVDAATVRATLLEAMPHALVEVQDDSHLHAGHAGASQGRHFSVRLVSPQFIGLGRVARHRLVYDALALLIPQGIHALAIDAQAPDAARPST